ncbi:AbiJ-NTD4 domain-containing protein [Candidatus Nitrospira inopinata]|jgi:hypothetical protein|uniref:HEPN AbiJ-N-terminal domain-containing protein n=1 Tax=Candidatus Nitrospira inopinata TaxID=1715989 RepID=A0A0S4KV03_9BACT|nr:hypothetical protein [Candidatus Nitrospira inopinata]CUQ67016.1 conserved protein of unknown function [Candidatus Nitrospira inopinata]
MKTFSQRKGLKPVSEVIQVTWMSEELRNSLWNALDTALWSSENFVWRQHGEPHIEPFSRSLWFHYFKKPIDSRPDQNDEILGEIRRYFFACEWYEVYDFLEFVVADFARSKPRLAEYLNSILGRDLSGYRFISGTLVDITNEQEVQLLDEALADTRFVGVSAHLKRSLELLADRDNPDYRNSIKESISAVESMARIMTDNSKATLADALKVLEKSGRLHPALKEGFLRLYGYTSDEQGIRHAMLDEPNLTSADAKFFLLSCTSFVNYLKSQVP